MKMILTKQIEITITTKRKKIYDGKVGSKIKIKIEKLTFGSNYKILAKCDFCDNEKYISYKEYNKNTKNGTIEFACCHKCSVEKLKKTMFDKYGVESAMQLEKIKEKIKNTVKEKYGVEHISQLEEVKEKKKITCFEHYGVENPLQSEIIKEKVKETNNEKYGFDYGLSSKEIQEKKNETVKNRYGVNNISELEEVKEKKRKSSNETCGYDYGFLQKEKSIITNLKKYGVEYPMQNKDIMKNLKNIFFEKYGFDWPTKSPEVKEKLIKGLLEYNLNNNPYRKDYIIDNDINYIKYLGNKNHLLNCDCNKTHTFEIDSDNYFKRISRNCPICTECYPINELSSIKEKELNNYISKIYYNKIISNYRDGLEIDIYLPELKIGFEFNGLYYHSELYRDKHYHLYKLNYFKEKGIRIYYIYEDDWDFKKEIIKSQIKNWLNITENKIYARQCEIRIIENSKIVSEFLNKNHIQGKVKSKLKIGLFYKNELVSLMTFDNFEGRKKMSDVEWNLSRFVSKLNTIVIGAAGKLLSYFIKNYNPKRIITFADKDWSDGKLYEKLGFKLLYETKPNYKYIVDDVRCNKQKFTKKKLFNRENENLSESTIMKNKKILRIYDSGQMKFELKNEIKI